MEHNIFHPEKTIKSYLDLSKVGDKPTIMGRMSRFDVRKKRLFGTIVDGSCNIGLQFTCSRSEIEPEWMTKFLSSATVGSSVIISGEIVKSPSHGQIVEMVLEVAEIMSNVRDIGKYLYGSDSTKKRSEDCWSEYVKGLRSDIYGRFRHPIMQSLMRIRGNLKVYLMEFFRTSGFIQVDPPLLTKSDCEGAGEMFQVTTLDLSDVCKTKNGMVDYSKDFFATQANLTVSGQLEAEAMAQSLGKVFSFGPTFRAENSNTSRHLAEFWMLEPEMIFTDVEEDKRFSKLLDLEESMVKVVIAKLLSQDLDDLKFLDSSISPGLIEKLTNVRDSSFVRLSYTSAIEILTKAVADGVKFEESHIEWGMDLASEHERYICETVYTKPTFVTNYPQDLKSFYMKANKKFESGKRTCQAVDLLVPGIGELCGGSMREDDPGKLMDVMKSKGVPITDLQWYIDLRYDGGLPTGGFGLGFERLVSFVTGSKSVRDVIAFPRYPKHI